MWLQNRWRRLLASKHSTDSLCETLRSQSSSRAMSHPLITKSFLLTWLLLPSLSSPHGTEMVEGEGAITILLSLTLFLYMTNTPLLPMLSPLLAGMWCFGRLCSGSAFCLWVSSHQDQLLGAFSLSIAHKKGLHYKTLSMGFGYQWWPVDLVSCTGAGYDNHRGRRKVIPQVVWFLNIRFKDLLWHRAGMTSQLCLVLQSVTDLAVCPLWAALAAAECWQRRKGVKKSRGCYYCRVGSSFLMLAVSQRLLDRLTVRG